MSIIFRSLRELYQTGVCCQKDLVNECGKLDIKCDSSVKHQKSGEHNYGNLISTEFRKKYTFQKVEPKVSQVTELVATLKKVKKRNENQRKTPHKRAAKTS